MVFLFSEFLYLLFSRGGGGGVGFVLRVGEKDFYGCIVSFIILYEWVFRVVLFVFELDF